MLWKKVLVGVLLLGICRCYGGISIEGDGRVSFGGGVTATPMLFGENYSYPAEYRGALRAAPAPGARSGVISGEWKLHTGKCGLVTLLWHDAGNGAKELEYRVNFSEPIPIAELALSFTLPLEFGSREVRIDSEKLVLPLTSPKEPTLAVINNSRTLTLALDDGILNVESKQPFSACVMDNRNFQQYNYSIRLRFPGVESSLRSASMKVRVRFQPYTVTALDLSAAANRGFADAKADDGEGGWNDQGPKTDLSQLPAGKLNVGPFSMTILDEARRPGKSCVVSSDAPNREWQPEAIPLPYSPGNDDGIAFVLLGCFFLSSYVLAHSSKFLLQLGEGFLLHRERASIFGTSAGSDIRYMLLLVVQTCVLAGLYLFVCFNAACPDLVVRIGSMGLLGVCVAGCAVYIGLKWLAYLLLEWTFFDKQISSFWEESYATLIYYSGFLLSPFLLLAIYLNFSLQISVIIGLLLLALVKILILYKWIKLFCYNLFGGLVLILYFCALEIIPCVMFYKGMTQLNDYLIINF